MHVEHGPSSQTCCAISVTTDAIRNRWRPTTEEITFAMRYYRVRHGESRTSVRIRISIVIMMLRRRRFFVFAAAEGPVTDVV